MVENNFCLWCSEKVGRLSSLIPKESQPVHIECYARSTLECEDDPVLSKKEAAIAAYILYEEQVAVLDKITLSY